MRWPMYSMTMTISGIFMGIGFITATRDFFLGLIIFSMGVGIFAFGYRGK